MRRSAMWHGWLLPFILISTLYVLAFVFTKKSAGDQGGEKADASDTDEHHDHGNKSSSGCDGINIAVSNCGDGDHGPPDAIFVAVEGWIHALFGIEEAERTGQNGESYEA